MGPVTDCLQCSVSTLRQRQETAGAEQDFWVERAGFERDFGIAAKAEGAHGDGLDHGAVAADGGALGVEARAPAVEHGDVGGGAADVGDDGVVEAGHVARADEACGRAGQNCLD